jgi:hypothetical protein
MKTKTISLAILALSFFVSSFENAIELIGSYLPDLLN